MTFLHPAALWALALAIPILLLHVLRPRRTPVVIGSTFLWRKVDRPVSSATPWQRLRPSWLLFLQLLAVVLLAMALARPVRLTSSPLAPHTVFVLDASGSMAATDGKPDRLGDAAAEAKKLRRQLPAGGIASIVVADPQPRVALSSSSDLGAFDEAIGKVRVSAGAPDWEAALFLASSLDSPGDPVGWVLISDGGVPAAAQKAIPPGTRYVRVGERATNRAITRLTVSPQEGKLHGRVTLRNTGGPSAKQTLRVDVDGRTAVRQPVNLAAGKTLEVAVNLPAGERVEAFLEGDDLRMEDNRAVAVAGGRVPLRVLVAGPANVFLDEALAALPGVSVRRVGTSRSGAGYDLAVYDRVGVPADPAVPYIAIAPTGGAPGVKVSGSVENPVAALVRTDRALAAGLDLSEVAIAEAQVLEAPDRDVLVASEDTPLILSGTAGGRNYGYFGFSLEDSNLPVQVSFPLLVDRMVTQLTGTSSVSSDLRVGQALPVRGLGALRVTNPIGRTSAVPVGGAAPIADRPGFFTVEAAGRPARVFAVNPDAGEASLAPAHSLKIAPGGPPAGLRRPVGEFSMLRWLVAILLGVLAVEWVVARRSAGVTRRRWRVARVMRGLLAGALVASLVGVTFPRVGRKVSVLFLVDASDSVGPDAQADALAWVRETLDDLPRGARAGVALFGGDAQLELSVQVRAELGFPAVKIDPSRTNVAGALRLAEAVLPSDTRRRVVVLSDGRFTHGDALAEVERLKGIGVRVDVVPFGRLGRSDRAVERVDAPSRVRPGEQYTVTARVTATRADSVRVVLRRSNGTAAPVTVLDEERRLVVGENILEFTDTIPKDADGGVVRYEVSLEGAADAVQENDVGYGAVQVEGPAKVLVVEGTIGESRPLVSALVATGVKVDVVSPAALPALEQLIAYASTVLVNVEARSLTDGQTAALSAAVKDLGRGLVVLGGSRSFALGGYRQSELESLLPVESEVRDPKRRLTVAQVLVLDTSGSMGACHCAAEPGVGARESGGVDKTEISRAAALRAIDALGADDLVGVMSFTTSTRWVVELTKNPDRRVVREQLATINPEGPTALDLPLPEAGLALEKAKAGLKHIVLFTDGFASSWELEELVDQARELAEKGITVSVLATGEGAAEDLRAVAEAGRGRFYPGTDLNHIPEIMAQESIIASRTFVNEGSFVPTVTSTAGAVRDLRAAPPVLGFVATTPKPTADTLLQVGPDKDPLLASWHTGLGKVTAWTSDVGDRWAQPWAQWSGFPQFWAGVVKDTFAPTGGDVDVRVEPVGDRIRVVVEGAADFADGAAAEARVVAPDGTSRSVPLERTGETTFAGEIAAGAAGSYAVGAVVRDGAGTRLGAGSGLGNRGYSEEYRTGGIDEQSLTELSVRSGGRGVIERGSAAFDPNGLPAGRSRVPLAGWLLLAAALAWPIDVALRRLTFVTALRAAREMRVGAGKALATTLKGAPRVSDVGSGASRPGRGTPPG